MEFRSYTRAIDQLDQLADRELISRIERRYAVPLIQHYGLPQCWRPVKLHLDPRDYYAGYLNVRDDMEVPYELRRDLSERVPQALLRDLARVVYPDEPIERRPVELALDPGGRQALAEARSARVLPPLPTIEPLVEQVMAEQERQRRLRRDPWPVFLPDDAPRNFREMYNFAD
jgi:hypothetical protein